LLAAATGNQMLRFLTHGIAQVLSGLIQARQPAPIDDLVERRREILKYLRARDADTAGKLLSKHLMRVHARMNGPMRAKVPQTGVSALYEKQILHGDSGRA
jgi:GntR family transcriptional repressor for pyruvate dehydrogenase complex